MLFSVLLVHCKANGPPNGIMGGYLHRISYRKREKALNQKYTSVGVSLDVNTK